MALYSQAIEIVLEASVRRCNERIRESLDLPRRRERKLRREASQ